MFFFTTKDLPECDELMQKYTEGNVLAHSTIMFRREIANKIVEDIQSNGGILSLDDLENYEAKDSKVLEGSYRPGHFKGVSHVVHNLFYLTKPSSAYFGLKDIQQFAIIQKMNETTGLNIDLIGCPTIRSKEGLALSSRNEKLSNEGLQQALMIIKTLRFVEKNKKQYNPVDLKNKAIELFENGDLKLEYLDIVNAKTFKQIESFEEPSVCCIAAYCENTRLIDNILLESVLSNENIK